MIRVVAGLDVVFNDAVPIIEAVLCDFDIVECVYV